jgi:hypothetical protein
MTDYRPVTTIPKGQKFFVPQMKIITEFAT